MVAPIAFRNLSAVAMTLTLCSGLPGSAEAQQSSLKAPLLPSQPGVNPQDVRPKGNTTDFIPTTVTRTSKGELVVPSPTGFSAMTYPSRESQGLTPAALKKLIKETEERLVRSDRAVAEIGVESLKALLLDLREQQPISEEYLKRAMEQKDLFSRLERESAETAGKLHALKRTSLLVYAVWGGTALMVAAHILRHQMKRSKTAGFAGAVQALALAEEEGSEALVQGGTKNSVQNLRLAMWYIEQAQEAFKGVNRAGSSKGDNSHAKPNLFGSIADLLKITTNKLDGIGVSPLEPTEVPTSKYAKYFAALSEQARGLEKEITERREAFENELHLVVEAMVTERLAAMDIKNRDSTIEMNRSAELLEAKRVELEQTDELVRGRQKKVEMETEVNSKSRVELAEREKQLAERTERLKQRENEIQASERKLNDLKVVVESLLDLSGDDLVQRLVADPDLMVLTFAAALDKLEKSTCLSA